MIKGVTPISILGVILGLSFVVSAAEFKRVDSGTLAWLRAIQFVDDSTGWIGGSSGTLLKTTDGGATWRKSPIPTKDNIRDIFFAGSEGWLLCEPDGPPGVLKASRIFKTSDRGATWTEIETEEGPERMVRLVGTPEDGLLLVIGESGTILSRSTYGTSTRFRRQALASRTMLIDGTFLDHENVVLVGGSGTILRSPNRGITWPKADSGNRGRSRLNSIFFLNASRGWVVGSKGYAASSFDGARSWIELVTDTEEDLNDVFFADARIGYAVGQNGTLLITTNAGQTWKRRYVGNGHALDRIATASGRALVIGFGGMILMEVKDGSLS